MRVFEFVLTSLAIEVTPGPNMAYIVALAATQGRRAGLAAVAGIAAGLALYGMAAALGLAALIAAVPALYQLLRWGGVVYLLYLAFDAWRGPGDGEASAPPPGDGALVWRSFVVNVLNPKAGIFYVAILPGFVDPAAGMPLPQNLTLVAIYVAVATLVHTALVLMASALRPWLIAGNRRELWLRRGLAVTLVAIAIWMLWSTRGI
jgi:threonine/homoserine/homoserine lactone efflux protein